MDQRIRFCPVGERRVAYAVLGSGPPLVFPAWWISHLEADWAMPAMRGFFSALAEEHTVIRYDRLGCGVSDREATAADSTLEAELRVIGLLLAREEVERASLFGVSSGGALAAAWAAAHPQTVEKLVLCGS